jgi:Ni,Fe-hydrogenase maturation factor
LLKKGYRRHGLLWTADAIGQRVADRIEQIPREDDIIDVGFHLVERESA